MYYNFIFAISLILSNESKVLRMPFSKQTIFLALIHSLTVVHSFFLFYEICITVMFTS